MKNRYYRQINDPEMKADIVSKLFCNVIKPDMVFNFNYNSINNNRRCLLYDGTDNVPIIFDRVEILSRENFLSDSTWYIIFSRSDSNDFNDFKMYTCNKDTIEHILNIITTAPDNFQILVDFTIYERI